MADKLYKFDVNGRKVNALDCTLMYPNYDGNDEPKKFSALLANLCHVRAADSLIIMYDLNRDGWVIFQQESCEEDGCDKCIALVGPGSGWKEVAYIPAWGTEHE